MNDKTIAWFSCGATSAIACKYAIKMYPNVEIIYIETGSSHCDNLRFIREMLQPQHIEELQRRKFTAVRFSVCGNVLQLKGAEYPFEKRFSAVSVITVHIFFENVIHMGIPSVWFYSGISFSRRPKVFLRKKRYRH